MTNISSESDLQLHFVTGKVTDKSMSMTIVNGTEKTIYNQLDKTLTYKTSIKFPCQIKILVYNKTDQDVLIDSNNNIVADTFILLENIIVDNLACNKFYLKQAPRLTTNTGQMLHDNYWGFNGEVILNFPQKNSILWALETESFKP